MKGFSSYYFPFKLMLWLWLLLSSFFLFMTFKENSPVKLYVSPTNNYDALGEPFDSIPGAKLYMRGIMEISDPSLKNRLFIPNQMWEMDWLTTILIIGLFVLSLRLINRLELGIGFKANLSTMLRFAGIAIIIFFIINTLRAAYAANFVRELTNEKFHYDHFSSLNHLFVIAGIILIWFSRMYKKGVILQQEQDLTV